MDIQVNKNLFNNRIFFLSLLKILAQLNLQNHYLLKNVAPASEDYKVAQIHFHWGHARDDMNGSEHLYEGHSYPLEVSKRINFAHFNLTY